MYNIFCPKCNNITSHKGAIDGNGEFIFHCQTEGCDMFVKFPRVKSKDELLQMIADREAINKPVVEEVKSHQEQQAILAEVLADGTNVTVTSAEQ